MKADGHDTLGTVLAKVSVIQCEDRAKEKPTNLRDGKTGEFHKLIYGECTGAHQLLVQSGSGLCAQCLSWLSVLASRYAPVDTTDLERHHNPCKGVFLFLSRLQFG